MVDIQVDGSGNLVRSGGERSTTRRTTTRSTRSTTGRSAPTSTTASRSSTPRAVVTDDPTPPGVVVLGGLFSGVHYWVHVDGSDPHRIQLSDSECHAGVGTYDADPRRLRQRSTSSRRAASNIQTLSLTPNFSPDAQKTTHTLRRADRPAIFTEGNMYFVDNVVANTSFRLLRPVTLAPVVPFSGGQLERDASSRQRGHRGRLDRDRHAEPGRRPDSSRLRLAARARRHRRPGVAPRARQDGVVSAHLDRHRRRPVRPPRRDVVHGVARPKVTTTIGAATLRGEDILISSASQANVAVASIGEGGGFASFGESNANADVTNTVHTTIDGGADLFATHNVAITAKGIDIANGKAVNATGGLIAGADTDSTLEMGYDVKTDGRRHGRRQPHAADRLGRRLRREVYARSSSGGLGTERRRQRRLRPGHPHRPGLRRRWSSRGSSTAPDRGEARLRLRRRRCRARASTSRTATSRRAPSRAKADGEEQRPRGGARRRLRRERVRPVQRQRPGRARRQLADRGRRSRACAPRTRTSTSRPTPARAARAAAATPTRRRA